MFDKLIGKALADPYSQISLVRRLLAEYAAVQWRAYVFAAVLMGVVAASTAAGAYLIGHAINEAYGSRNILVVIGVCAGIIAVSTLRGFASYWQAVQMGRIKNRIVATNQRRLFEKILHQGSAFFANRHSSEFSARIMWGANSASDTLNLLISACCRDAMQLIGLCAVMVSQSPSLALTTVVIGPPAILVGRKAVERVRAILRYEFAAGANVLEVVQETVQGFNIVQAFGLESIMRDRVNSYVTKIEEASNRLTRASNFVAPLMEALGGIAIALVILVGCYRVLVSNAAPGDYTAFLTAFILAYEPAKRMARLNIDLGNSLVGVRIFYEFLDLPERPDDSTKPDIKIRGGSIEFCDVRFGYHPDVAVLKGMSFCAEPGCITALVGPSGGGKSTVFNLLLRLYEGYQGSILIDGTEVSTVSRHLLRGHFAFVGQDAFLFRGSIRDNIAFGRSGATDQEVVTAAKAAHADDFIKQFPSGYDTQVGEHGMQLSGGQRQRISVARALIRKAPIILLDEPTTFLDSEAERYVNLAISQLFGGRTRLIIAHRLHTISHADKICVVEDGRIVECGRHDPLLRQGGRYAHFVNLQLTRERELQLA